MQAAQARFKYQQALDVVEDDDGGILDVPQIGAYRTQEAIPPHVFEKERFLALSPIQPTGFIDLDISQILGTPYPATTPLLLCRYVVLRDGEMLTNQLCATGEDFYVICGTGSSTNEARTISWKQGDVFVFPGNDRITHQAFGGDALLFMATDEPQLAYCRAVPQDQDHPVLAAHFKADDIELRLQGIYAKSQEHQAAGKFVSFYTRPMAHMRSMLPAMNVALNSLEPGGNQRSHKHNAVAVTLSIQGEGVYSLLDGEKVEWPKFGVFITPPATPHSHHNPGPLEMRSFVVQDSGFHSYCRTPGLIFAPTTAG